MPLKSTSNDPVVCTGVITNIDTDEAYYDVQFTTHDGRKSRAVPGQIFVSPSLFMKELSKHGYNGDLDFIVALAQNGNQCNLPATKITERGGWVDNCLVTRFGVFGPDKSKRRLNFKADHPHYKPSQKQGTIDDFIDNYEELMVASPEICLSYLAALAAPLGAQLERSSFSICFSSESTTGKTSVIAFAQSLYTFAYNDDDLVNFGDTLGVLLDDLDVFGGTVTGFADVKNSREKRGDWADKLQTLTFSASSGHRRRRLSSVPVPRTSGPNRKVFNIFMLATERPLSELYRQGGTRREGGDMTRLIEIPVARRTEGGIFCNISDAAERDRLAIRFDELRRTQHGTIIPDWVAYLSSTELTEPKRLADEIKASEDAFMDQLNEPDPLFRRIGKHIALLAAVIPIAERAQLLPVESQIFREALHEIFRRIVKSQKVLELEQLRYNHERIREILEKGFYPVLQAGEAPAEPQKAAICFKRKPKGTTHIHFHAESFISSFDDASRHLAVKFVKWLKDNVQLQPGSGETNTRPVQQEGLGRRRYLIFTYNDAKSAERALRELLEG